MHRDKPNGSAKYPALKYVIKEDVFCHSGLTLSILLCHSVLYSLSLYV